MHNASFDAGLVKRKGQVLIQTQAGTPSSTWAWTSRNAWPLAGATTSSAALCDVDSWDYVVSANRHSTLTRERVHPGGYTTLEYGQPRTDVLQRGRRPADVTRLRETLGIPRRHGRDPLRAHHATTRTQRRPGPGRLTRLGPASWVLARAHPRHGGPLAEPPGPGSSTSAATRAWSHALPDLETPSSPTTRH
ncbi:CDP-glycerol glycerophosphotransferase family protein [Streptomyces thinghirensis]|nr:CDP-glycerol glycerophosphotransferase family protein [Streptomyces thinghirensis]